MTRRRFQTFERFVGFEKRNFESILRRQVLIIAMKSRKELEVTVEGSKHQLSFSSDEEGLTLVLKDPLGFTTWQNTFGKSTVEAITAKTGSQKSYSTFLKMLGSAAEGASDLVSFNILTNTQIEAMRGKSQSQQKKSTGPQNRYFILTYNSEFDSVHYPLVLLPEEEEDPVALKEIIRKLQELRPSAAEGNVLLPSSEALKSELLFERREREKQSEAHRAELSSLCARVESLSRENERLTAELAAARRSTRKSIPEPKSHPGKIAISTPEAKFSSAKRPGVPSHDSTRRKIGERPPRSSQRSMLSSCSVSRISQHSSSNRSARSSKMSSNIGDDSFVRRKKVLQGYAQPVRKARPPSSGISNLAAARKLSSSKFPPRKF